MNRRCRALRNGILLPQSLSRSAGAQHPAALVSLDQRPPRAERPMYLVYLVRHTVQRPENIGIKPGSFRRFPVSPLFRHGLIVAAGAGVVLRHDDQH